MLILSNMIHTILSSVGYSCVRSVARTLVLVLCFMLLATPAMANSQAPAGGGSVLNILFLVLIAYFLVRMFRRRSGRGNDSREDYRGQDQDRNVRPIDRHDAARQAWSHLSSDKEQSSSVPTTPTGEAAPFNEGEFLEGAKLFFSRFQQAGNKQEFEDLRGFMSSGVYADVMDQVARGSLGGESEIMLLNAKLMEVKSEGKLTLATVFYDAQIRIGASGDRAEHIRAVWEFSRDEDVPGGLWTLEKINKVDQ